MSKDIGSKQLGEYLKIIIRTLELGGITHNYNQMSTSNFGLMAQIVLDYTENDFFRKLSRWSYSDNYAYYNYTKFDNDTKIVNERGIWWRQNIKTWWSVNGKPLDNSNDGLFHTLYRKGFTRYRILELEYLDNPTVNKAFEEYDWGTVEKDILEDKLETKLEPIMVTNTVEKWVNDTSLWGRIWGKRKKIVEKSEMFTGEHNLLEETVKVKVGTEMVPTKKDFRNSKHTIIYYKKWVELIEEKITEEENVVKTNKFQDKLNKLVKDNKKK